ncbi:MAG: response regulator [Gammaproteobacteria bacterium]|nr:response regulator [Gammaproteobacteria bacterium]
MLLFTPSAVAAGVEAVQGLAAVTYLVKPLKRGALLGALDALVEAPAAAPLAAIAPTLSRHTARVLLVEDNPDNRLLIKAYLRQTGYQLVEAEDGAQAVARCQSESFDLVLMDVQMPVMDGYAATRAIRAFEQAQGRPRTPVIALTANAVKEDMDASRAAGCDDHLTKPIKKQTLLDALAAHLVKQTSVAS